MNLSQIKQLQTVDGWIDFSAQIIEIKETKQRTQKNRLMTKVKLKDETDEIGAWLYADTQQFTPNQIVTGNGMLKEYKDIRYLDYATVAKSTQQAPQNAPQAPSQATGRPNGKENIDWDVKDLRTARENGLNNATKIICLLAEMTKNDASLNINHVKGVASELVDYIYNGLKGEAPKLSGQSNPDYVGDDPTADLIEFPFNKKGKDAYGSY